MSCPECVEVMVFLADWCGYCQKFKPVLEQLVDETKDHYLITWTIYTEGTTRGDNAIRANDVSGFPTIMLKKENSRPVEYQRSIVSDDPGTQRRYKRRLMNTIFDF